MGPVVNKIGGQENLISEEQEEYKPYHPERGYGWAGALPEKQGLYDPQLEKDACGVGFAAYVFRPGRALKFARLTITTAISRAGQVIKSSAMVCS